MLGLLYATYGAWPFVAMFIVAVGFVLKSTLGGSGPKGPNPFEKDVREARRPFVADTKARDSVLKQGFSRKLFKGDEANQFDAIVVGSGIGGMTTASLLAKAGKKVLVLEQHDQAGGCCHTYHEEGFEFDTGIHYIGEVP